MPKGFLNEFNDSETLAIISPYSKGEHNFRGFSIGRYTRLITNSFPRNQNVVIFSSLGRSRKAYKIAKNILIVPSYKFNQFGFLKGLIEETSKFNEIKNFLIQFEFSIFGGKIVIPQFIALLIYLKMKGKSTKVILHQVVSNLGSLSGHLAIGKGSLKTQILNCLLKIFYKLVGILSDRIFVHDRIFVKRLVGLININKISIIPHGIQTGETLSKKETVLAKKYFGMKSDTKLIGIFGYCSWYKGTDWLIENFSKFAKNHPELKIKLLVAGGESPTLKGTSAYKKYHSKLREVIKNASGNIIYTGFVAESDVRKVFAACDLMVFPYRVRMSASGAFSLSAGYKKPFIASREFSKNLGLTVYSKNIFSLDYKSFEKSLLASLKSTEDFVDVGSETALWQDTALKYLNESLQPGTIESKLSYAEVV